MFVSGYFKIRMRIFGTEKRGEAKQHVFVPLRTIASEENSKQIFSSSFFLTGRFVWRNNRTTWISHAPIRNRRTMQFPVFGLFFFSPVRIRMQENQKFLYRGTLRGEGRRGKSIFQFRGHFSHMGEDNIFSKFYSRKSQIYLSSPPLSRGFNSKVLVTNLV